MRSFRSYPTHLWNVFICAGLQPHFELFLNWVCSLFIPPCLVLDILMSQKSRVVDLSLPFCPLPTRQQPHSPSYSCIFLHSPSLLQYVRLWEFGNLSGHPYQPRFRMRRLVRYHQQPPERFPPSTRPSIEGTASPLSFLRRPALSPHGRRGPG